MFNDHSFHLPSSRRWLQLTLFMLISAVFLLLATLQPAAANGDPRRDNNPRIIYGTRAELANNIVLQIDDNVYEGNIRWLFDILQARGLKATFFPHTRYMLKQDAQLWRDIVAAGNEIGYFTRNHAHGLTVAEFTQDFALYQEELRGILGDSNYTIKYAKPACWAWEDSWFDWLETTNLIGVKTNILGPATSIDYMSGVFNDTQDGGHIISIISFTEHIEWFEANLDALMSLKAPNGQPYTITSLSNALND